MTKKSFDKKDFNFAYSYCGYMIYYKNSPIGGAGILNKLNGRKVKGNLEFYKNLAEITIRDILDGKVSKDMKEAINKINRKRKQKLII